MATVAQGPVPTARGADARTELVSSGRQLELTFVFYYWSGFILFYFFFFIYTILFIDSVLFHPFPLLISDDCSSWLFSSRSLHKSRLLSFLSSLRLPGPVLLFQVPLEDDHPGISGFGPIDRDRPGTTPSVRIRSAVYSVYYYHHPSNLLAWRRSSVNTLI